MNRYARNLIARIQKNQDDLEAIRLLEAHYVNEGDQPSLANLMEGWGDTLKDPRLAADAYVRAADATLLGGGDRSRAKTLYERALNRDPSHAEALDRVLRVLSDLGDHDREKQVLKFVAYQMGERGGDPVHLASVLYRLGVVYETHFGEPGKAAASYRRAIEVNPKLTAAITAARRIYADVGNTNAVAVLYEFEIDATPAPEDKRALLIALAELREHEQADLDEAVVVLRRALKLLPSDVEALRKLGELLVRRSERFGNALGEEAQSDRRRAAEVFYQVGRTVPERSAQSYLERALELDPGHERAASALRELQARAGATDTEKVTLEPPVEPPLRDSAEAWLHDGEPEDESTLSTGELLPIEPELREDEEPVELRPSSLPPRELHDEARLSHVAMHDALRAPRLPDEAPARGAGLPRSDAPGPRMRSVPPPPPPSAAARSRTVPPPPPMAEPAHVAIPSPPPPAYAEIPGAGSSEEPAPARAQRVSAPPPALLDDEPMATAQARKPRDAEPTLIAWRLPDTGASHESEPVAADVQPIAAHAPNAAEPAPVSAPNLHLLAPTPVVSAAPEMLRASARPDPKPAKPAKRASEPAPRRSSLPAAKPRSSAPPGVLNTPYPSQAGSTRLRTAQDERVAQLMRSVREGHEAVMAPAAVHAPAPAPVAATSPGPAHLPPSAAPVATPPSAALAAPAVPPPSAAPVYAAATPPSAAPVHAPAPAAPAPASVRPPAPLATPPRACIVDGELLHDPGRAPLEVNLGATTDSNFYVGFSNRLADGGVFVATYSSLPLGSEVELLITLP
ncbi:MAG TPA: hypothetical protein VHM19_10735, partial [Polyangiales bacterium]|nr:hypothetical protein [Polyangiales bacterium]